MLAPIVLFTYNRPSHTRQTIEALKKNVLADKSDVFIYSDAPRREEEEAFVMQVRKYLSTITGFRSVKVIEQKINVGIAVNMINGITDILRMYGKIIVLEDDVFTSSKFLTYMNEALDKYKNVSEVWHVSAWQYPLNTNKLEKNTLAFSRLMNSWGWGTWEDRWAQNKWKDNWSFYCKHAQELMNSFSNRDIYNFNLKIRGDGDFWSQVLSINRGEIEAWDIYWYATIFKHKGLCLVPIHSFVNNIGIDGSGFHYTSKNHVLNIESIYEGDWKFPEVVKEQKLLVKEIKKFLISSNPRYISEFQHLKNNVKDFLLKNIISKFPPKWQNVLRKNKGAGMDKRI